MRKDFYFPITKAQDTEDGGLILEGIATAEIKDSEKEVMDYESARKCFQDWFSIGNIREQHDVFKAVGVALDWHYNNDQKYITLLVKISAGARSTILKIKDGVLKGFSVGAETKKIYDSAIGATRLIMERLIEVSVVDRPSVPLAMFNIVKVLQTKGEKMNEKNLLILKELHTKLTEIVNALEDGDLKTNLASMLTALNEVVSSEENAPPTEAPEEPKADNSDDKCNRKADEKADDKPKDKADNQTSNKADEKPANNGLVEKLVKMMEDIQKRLAATEQTIEKISKTVKPPGTPTTKGEPPKPETELEKEITELVEKCEGDPVKFQTEFATFLTKKALTRK